jgi:uncharacterized protein (UPF0276 family)
MLDLVVSPVSFAPTKVGYKQYIKAGGAMQFANFQVFERRTEIEILLDKAERLYNAVNYHNSQDEYYKSINDSEGRKIHLASYEIRLDQYIDVCHQLKKLGVIHE